MFLRSENLWRTTTVYGRHKSDAISPLDLQTKGLNLQLRWLCASEWTIQAS